MELKALLDSLAQTVGAQLPMVLSALAVMVLGWLVAVLARGAARRGLRWLKLDERIEASSGTQLPAEGFVAGLLFWLVVLLTLVAVFNVLNLQQVSGTIGTLISQVLSYLPKLLAGSLLALVAWIVAVLVRTFAQKTLAATDLDDRLTREADMEPMSRTAAQVLFWLVILMFLPMVLAAFDLSGLLDPLTHMIDRMLGIIPNLFAAAVIGLVGYTVAKIVRGLVVSLLGATRAEELARKAGLRDGVRLAQLVGTLVFMFIFIPSLIAALDALKVEAISRPATEMLSQLLSAVPKLIAATLIIFISFYVGRFASGLLASLLNSLGFDTIPAKLGVQDRTAGWVPSAMVGQIAMLAIMLLAVAEAADQLGFSQVRELVSMFIQFGADILLGGVILAIGFWVANLVYAAVARASGGSGLAAIARYAVMGLVIAMGLRAMGVADDIVNLAFGLTLGAVAVAVALAFGLGGREAAGRQMEYWLSKLRK